MLTHKIGDVVRIAPNELVFITPQAATCTYQREHLTIGVKENADIYASHTKHIEHFPKTNSIELGAGDQGITWEKDPVKHQRIAKMEGMWEKPKFWVRFHDMRRDD